MIRKYATKRGFNWLKRGAGSITNIWNRFGTALCSQTLSCHLSRLLVQKSKTQIESEITKRSKRPTKVVTLNDDYNQLLTRKRLEERKHRQLNGFDGLDTLGGHSPVPDGTGDYKVATVGQFHCSNNKFVPEYITPRSRLLASHSSRVKALQYREELRKQIEEKERLKAEERERIRLEDEELERKLEAQRIKLLAEYEDEQRLIRAKAKEMTIKDDVSKPLPNREVLTASSSPLSVLRSPTYMQIKGVRTSTQSPPKSGKAFKSLAAAMSDADQTRRTIASQTSEDEETSSEEETDRKEDYQLEATQKCNQGLYD